MHIQASTPSSQRLLTALTALGFYIVSLSAAAPCQSECCDLAICKADHAKDPLNCTASCCNSYILTKAGCDQCLADNGCTPSPPPVPTPSPPGPGPVPGQSRQDLGSLAQFYKATAPTDGWKKGCADNWCKDPDDCPNKNFCTWVGITCTDDQKNVRDIRIGACNVQGTIPTSSQYPSLFGMTRVEIIEISPGPDLHLTGPLPDDWNSQTLRQVQLTGHKISGTIPASLYTCTSLTQIDLHSNALTGMLAEAIHQLVQLTYLSVADNNMQGQLPSKLPPKLTTLGLASNSFTGAIAPVYALAELVILFLRNNSFTGVVGASLAKSIQVLDLDHNNFRSIAPELCQGSELPALQKPNGCTQDYPGQDLQTCCLNNNDWATQVPAADCPALKNCFSGSVGKPKDWSALVKLNSECV